MMNGWQVSARQDLALMVALVGSLVGVLALPGWALDQPATTVTEWIAQVEASLVQITGVRVEETETGLQVVLETAAGELPVPTTQTVGNALIADIPNARIAENFERVEPIAEIARVEVTALPGDRVRVAITGTAAPPVAKVTSEAQRLAFAVTVGTVAAEEEAIEIVVTGEQDEEYNPSSASTATRTDTPLRDIPQSIQVVPQQVLEDRNVRTVTEALETVSGLASGSRPYGSAPITNKIIRGFDQAGTGTVNFRNGFPDGDYYVLSPIVTVERVEVLKGPASVLFGAGEPGRIVNTVTKQPLSEPYYKLAFEAGNYGLYQPSIDLSGPLNINKTVLYRFIASYQGSSDFQGFSDTRLTTIAPSVTLKVGEQTDLNLYYEYTHLFADPAAGISTAFLLSDGSLTPRDFATYYPSTGWRK